MDSLAHDPEVIECAIAPSPFRPSSPSAWASRPAATAQMNPRGEAKVTLAGKPIVVEYGRPSLKGRDMLGKAEVGQEWRMGADTATTLKTPAEPELRLDPVPPGEYVLRAKKVSDTDWALKLERDGKAAAEVPLRRARSTRASRSSPSTSPRSRARACSACPGATWRWPRASPRSRRSGGYWPA